MRVATHGGGGEPSLRLASTSPPFTELRAGCFRDEDDGEVGVGAVGRVQ